MPDQAIRSGDFSQAITDPSNGQPFPGNAIPASRMAPQSTALLKFYPLPNFPENAGYNYQVPLVGITHQDDVQGRVDRMFDRKHFVNGSFAYRNARSSDQCVRLRRHRQDQRDQRQCHLAVHGQPAAEFQPGVSVQPSGDAHHAVLREPRKRLGRSGNHGQ